MILAEEMHKAGIRAHVGKLSMDINDLWPSYCESSANASLSAAKSFVETLRSKNFPLVEPVLTPRFVPTCSPDLLKGLGKMSKEMGVRVQSHMAESKEQAAYVKDLRGVDDIHVFDMVRVTSEVDFFMA